MAGPVTRARTLRVEGATVRHREEQLATEEPLEIRIREGEGPARRLLVTMRTPVDIIARPSSIAAEITKATITDGMSALR